MTYRSISYEILENLKKVIIGKDDILEKVLVCFFARGHLLIEDIPGVGKTTLVKVLAKSISLDSSRIQFTPDLMPSDIIGVTIYNKTTQEFIFKKGPVFSQIILADEINRTSPKTQASLLQAMEEGEISVDNDTYFLRKPFMVLATQNPMDYQGTYPLPEAQLDRFLMKISLGYPMKNEEKKIILNYKESKTLENIKPVASEKDIINIQDEVDDVILHEDILQYIVNISAVSRNTEELHLGASPRVSIDLYRGAKSLAYIRGRDYVIPDDVKEIAPFVLSHRLILSAEARINGRKIEDVINKIIRRVNIPVVSQNEE